jgi:hypothetical protein
MRGIRLCGEGKANKQTNKQTRKLQLLGMVRMKIRGFEPLPSLMSSERGVARGMGGK